MFMKESLNIQIFEVLFTKGGEFFEKAQFLRSKVFLKEEQKDEDRFDKFCEHVVVIDRNTKQVVGTYRLLLGSVAKNSLGFYSETEFDLKNIKKNCSAELLELGRACVDESYRKYPIIKLMWKAIISYIEQNRVRYVLGCASIEEPTPKKVGKIFRFLKDKFFSPSRFRVYPLKDRRFPYLKDPGAYGKREVLQMLPSLVKGYLNIGAFVCGEPAWDKVFGTADFFMMLDTKRMNTSFVRKFL